MFLNIISCSTIGTDISPRNFNETAPFTVVRQTDRCTDKGTVDFIIYKYITQQIQTFELSDNAILLHWNISYQNKGIIEIII